jgi:hypothetical protein
MKLEPLDYTDIHTYVCIYIYIFHVFKVLDLLLMIAYLILMGMHIRIFQRYETH